MSIPNGTGPFHWRDFLLSRIRKWSSILNVTEKVLILCSCHNTLGLSLLFHCCVLFRFCFCLLVCLPKGLSVCLSICLIMCLSVCLSVCLSIYILMCLSVCILMCLSVCLYVCQFVCLPMCLFVFLFVCPSVFQSVYHQFPFLCSFRGRNKRIGFRSGVHFKSFAEKRYFSSTSTTLKKKSLSLVLAMYLR
jgi:hypothetical protein